MKSTWRKLRRWLVRENRIYIIPTGYGIAFLALVGVLVLTAATYNNNLIFILTFLLFAAFSVGMVQTHNNLKGVRLDYLNTQEGFEGQDIVLLFRLSQKRARTKQGLRLRTASKILPSVRHEPQRLASHERTKTTSLEVRPKTWGVHPVPEVILETFFPFGIFRAWKVFRPEGQVIVYPRPEGHAVLAQLSTGQADSDFGGGRSPEGDFGELKDYRDGEPHNQIAWKHYARTQNLYSKVHWGEQRRHFVIPWLGQQDDSQLRQMSRWIQLAVDENATFEMETPDTKFESGEGIEHARHCWRALARVRSLA